MTAAFQFPTKVKGGDVVATIVAMTGIAGAAAARLEDAALEAGYLTPRAAAELILMGLAGPHWSAPLGHVESTRLDTVFRMSLGDEAALVGGGDEVLRAILRKGTSLVDAVEALIRRAIVQPDDFLEGGAYADAELALDTASCEARLVLPALGERRELPFEQIGRHRAFPHFRREAIVAAPFFAAIGRLFYRL